MRTTRNWLFWVGFAAATMIIAGVVSSFASSGPDGLDSATLKGCEVVESGGTDELTGSCIAQHATDHPMATSPLADYALVGRDGTGGVAGIIGVVVTVAVAGAVFRVLARSRSKPTVGS
jgi:cobalt/nickel transport protein